jgi:uncharacterized protein (UPF0216 family)
MSLLSDSKRSLDRALDAVLGHELRKLNTHLPKQRRSLTELLKLKNPTVEANDGSAIVLKTSELEELARFVPAQYQDRLKLPIIIIRRMDLGRSIYTVSGERVEEFTVKKILGLTNDEYYQMYKDQDADYLYRPQVTELLRKFHSIFVIAFGVPKELSDYGPSLP